MPAGGLASAGLLSTLGAGAGAGEAIGAGLNLATSLVQGIQAKRLKNKAEAAMPELVDPNQAAFLAELNQKRRSIETGADFAGAMDNIDATTAGTQDAITKNTGGDVGGTIQALLQAQKSANGAKTGVIAQGQQQQAMYNNMYNNLLNQIAARRMQLQMYNSQQNMAQWAKQKQGANQNFMAGSAGLGSLLSGLKQQGAQPDVDPEYLPSKDPGLLPTGNIDAAELMGAL